jgi:hypothetical protein
MDFLEKKISKCQSYKWFLSTGLTKLALWPIKFRMATKMSISLLKSGKTSL